jgi:hypothetical protein
MTPLVAIAVGSFSLILSIFAKDEHRKDITSHVGIMFIMAASLQNLINFYASQGN